ncbi:MAG: hypothetical protein JNL98_27520 [Bryobacterales bacterium]|nr:hypothetical protein [Bryobacterales bacterium]
MSEVSAQSRHRTRADAARENGRKSKGAVTPEGQFRAATASLKHGLTGKCVVLSNECPRKYENMRNEYFDEWKPVGPSETDLLITAVNCNWRLQRIWAMESSVIDSAMFYKREEFEESYANHTSAMRAVDAVCALNANNKVNLETLQRYETTYTRGYDRALASLRKLQQARGQASCLEPRLRRNPAHSQQVLPPLLPKLSLPSLTPLLNWLRALCMLILSLTPWTKSGNSSTASQQDFHHEELAPETGTWQPHESQCDMPREEFLAETSGTFTVPEHLHYECHYTPSERLLIPNSCIGCPACNEREERARQETERAGKPLST